MKFGRGYIRDLPSKRTQKPIQHMLAAMPVLAAPIGAADLKRWECPILDQGQTSSCTGHGTAQGLFMAFGAKGAPLTWVPSPKLCYGLTRAVARVSVTTPLEDLGGMPADTMAGISTFGIAAGKFPAPDGRFSDVTPENVNDEPDFLALEQASMKIVAGEYRIDESASNVIDLVCLSLDAGVPVGIGAFVSSEFEEWVPGNAPCGLPNFSDPAGGGHWFILSSYSTHDSQRIFGCTNSWGAWADNGHALVSEAFIRAAYDLYALNVRPL